MTEKLNDLASLTPTELGERWVAAGVRGQPPLLKHALVRGIAWKLQTETHGGIDAETRRLLKAAVRNAPQPRAKNTRSAKAKHRNTLRLQAGTTLVRKWRGRTYEVTVLDECKAFRYRDAEYASLSEIAREITGARWSGPRFFGLTKLQGTA